jgi:hypothetical protein
VKQLSIPRQLLRKLLPERMRIVPQGINQYIFSGKAAFGRLLAGVLPKGLASHLITNWNQAVNWLRGMNSLRESEASFAGQRLS